MPSDEDSTGPVGGKAEAGAGKKAKFPLEEKAAISVGDAYRTWRCFALL